MRYVNYGLFEWMAGGFHPTPWLLAAACWIAVYGAWAAGLTVLYSGFRQPSQRLYLVLLLLLACITSVLSQAISSAVDMPRPFAIGMSPNYLQHGGRGAMPSTHMSVMSLVALGCLVRPGLHTAGAVLLALAFATAWGRIYAGAHFPADIAAGLLLGTVVLAVYTGLRSGVQWWMRRRYTAPDA
ncbi:phosphatase PAP2 family protein [Variovorax sp. PAMC28562]|uniref:phosphatase PAP2 family protein n=1 Tax=Variovorax sp. PAMC28562 TaxID=2762323 RepID=UPI00164DFE98|nr:phosphatase PAP2 family protein [Variovorax sp. PAMC28562]QNK74868.1 phosphatase PAP2 family protein [Variovorax sp. PAMC28562]